MEHFFESIEALYENKYFQLWEKIVIIVLIPALLAINVVQHQFTAKQVVLSVVLVILFWAFLLSVAICAVLVGIHATYKEKCDDPGCLCSSHVKPAVFDYEDETWHRYPCDDGSCSCIEHTYREEFVGGKWVTV